MSQSLITIKDSSRRLLGDENLSYPIRKLACAVCHGADLISHHQLENRSALPQFQRALFHLCHVVDRPLCGRCICDDADGELDGGSTCNAIILWS
ncbi:MAG: hypothetical protein EG825_06825 [Rhodocyclaceae bacterium]|nr:hypothetical protein [Rhodocyclaceae bacterium]